MPNDSADPFGTIVTRAQSDYCLAENAAQGLKMAKADVEWLVTEVDRLRTELADCVCGPSPEL